MRPKFIPLHFDRFQSLPKYILQTDQSKIKIDYQSTGDRRLGESIESLGEFSERKNLELRFDETSSGEIESFVDFLISGDERSKDL